MKIGLALVLVASLAANVYLLLTGSADDVEPRGIEEPALAMSDAECAVELKKYRALVVPAWISEPGAFGDVSQQAHEPASTLGEPMERGAVAARDAELSDEILCSIAREHLHRHWQGVRDQVTDALRRALTVPAERDKSFADTVGGYRAILGLEEGEGEAFRDAYRSVFETHVQRLTALVDVDPVDYAAVANALRAMFHAEDRLVEGRYGDQALARFRDGNAEKRTALLAIAATYVNPP